MFTALGAAAIGALAGLGTSAYNNYRSRSNTKYSAGLEYEYAKRYALNSPSWNVQGMRDAGINPILAAQSGTLGNVTLNGSSVANSPMNLSDINGSAQIGNDTKRNKLQESMNEGQLSNLETSSGLNVANTAKSNAEAQATTMRAQADVELAKAQVAKTQAETIALQQSNRDFGFKSSGFGFGSSKNSRKGFHANVSLSDAVRAGSYLYDGVKKSAKFGWNKVKSMQMYQPPVHDSVKDYVENSPTVYPDAGYLKFYDPSYWHNKAKESGFYDKVKRGFKNAPTYWRRGQLNRPSMGY